MKFIEVKTREDDRVFEGKNIIINMSHIAVVSTMGDSAYIVMLIDGSVVTLSDNIDIRELLLSTD